jgi:hypothetical protein
MKGTARKAALYMLPSLNVPTYSRCQYESINVPVKCRRSDGAARSR